MKRQTKTVSKRTYSLKGAIPRFVTLCGAGANLTPLSQLRFSETDKFGQDVEINRIEFAKTKFANHEEVANYLNQNAYEDFSIEEGESTWTVLGTDAEKFEDVQPIEYEDGVLYFIGKLKVPTEEDQPAAEIVEKEEFSDKTKEETVKATTEVVEEVVQESAEETVDEKENATSEETTSEEVSAEFEAEKEQEEVITTEEVAVAEFSMADVMAELSALRAELAETKENLAKFEQTNEEVVDETVLVIQNSNAINSDEIISEDVKQKDEKAVKFSQKIQNDLFGLRG